MAVYLEISSRAAAGRSMGSRWPELRTIRNASWSSTKYSP